MTLRRAATALFFPGLVVMAAHAQAGGPITEEASRAIGVDAYLYFYPLVTMEVTRRQSVNFEPGRSSAKAR